jgi:hypothetical protein
VGGAARNPIPENEIPSVGEVAVSLVTGSVEFNAADEGEPFAVAYTGVQSYVGAADFAQMGLELEAVQAAVGVVANVMTVGAGGQYATIGAALVAVAAMTRAADEWAVVRVLPGTYEEAVKVSSPRVVLYLMPGAFLEYECDAWVAGAAQADWPIQVLVDDVIITGCGEVRNPSITGAGTCIVFGENGLSTSAKRGVVRGVRVIGGHRDQIMFHVGADDGVVEGCYVQGYYDCIASSGLRNRVLRNHVKTINPAGDSRGGAPFWSGGGSVAFVSNIAEFDGSWWVNLTWAVDVILDGNVYVGNSTNDVLPSNIAASGTGSGAASGYLRVGNAMQCAVEIWGDGKADQTVAVSGGLGLETVGYVVAGGDVMAGGSIAAGGNLTIGGAVAPTIVEFDETVLALKAFSGGETVLEIAASDYDLGTQDFRIIRPAGAYDLHATHLKDGAGTLDASGITRCATLTTKGDLYVATAAGTLARLPAPPAGHALVADSSQATGWASIFVPRVLYANTANSTEITSFDAYTAYDLTYAFPIAALVVGSRFRVHASGIHSISSAGNTWFDVGIVLGTTYLMELRVGTVYASQTNNPWQVTADFTVRAIGASGSIKVGNCALIYRAGVAGQTQKDPVTIDLSSSPLTLAIRSRTGRADANDKATLTDFCVERLA